ncbi:hypothetical protein [Nocardia blacklockiae]|uniref:hypothetical protein n=1 Tax=Nocardia blacklockiae TaxID=480036 RepID=UPI0018949AF5|nr:hypothetical protein [Nocardia blacklockiae]MBF6174981.1 hypothetical protein [Nocardia blacklockiae]
MAMSRHILEKALVLLSVFVCPVAVAGPAEALPTTTIHCGKHYDSVDWQAPSLADTSHVDTLFFAVDVGGDDIRSGTGVSATVTFRTLFSRVDTRRSAVLTSDPHPNNSHFSGSVSLGSRSDDIESLVSPMDIFRVELVSASGQPDIFSTPDNWNMDSLSVQYTTFEDSRTFHPLVQGSGSPWLHRFKADCDNDSGEGGPLWTVVNPTV